MFDRHTVCVCLGHDDLASLLRLSLIVTENVIYSLLSSTHRKPYITWGYPNLKTVRELIYKRGHGKVSFYRFFLLFHGFLLVDSNLYVLYSTSSSLQYSL